MMKALETLSEQLFSLRQEEGGLLLLTESKPPCFLNSLQRHEALKWGAQSTSAGMQGEGGKKTGVWQNSSLRSWKICRGQSKFFINIKTALPKMAHISLALFRPYVCVPNAHFHTNAHTCIFHILLFEEQHVLTALALKYCICAVKRVKGVKKVVSKSCQVKGVK